MQNVIRTIDWVVAPRRAHEGLRIVTAAGAGTETPVRRRNANRAVPLNELADLLRWPADAPAHGADDQQIVYEAANRCQVIIGRAQVDTADALSELAASIETSQIPGSVAARYVLLSIWLKTLYGVLVPLCGTSTLFDSSVLKTVAQCILACDRFRGTASTRGAPPWPQVVIEALKFIDRRHGDPAMNLTRVAAAVGVSPWYLDRQLRRCLGTSFLPILRAIKIGHAITLLRSTTMSVKEITAATGYNCVTTFDRDFKRVHGVTPTVWRRRLAVQPAFGRH